jgi:hypothetical protein
MGTGRSVGLRSNRAIARAAYRKQDDIAKNSYSYDGGPNSFGALRRSRACTGPVRHCMVNHAALRFLVSRDRVPAVLRTPTVMANWVASGDAWRMPSACEERACDWVWDSRPNRVVSRDACVCLGRIINVDGIPPAWPHMPGISFGHHAIAMARQLGSDVYLR